MTTAYTPAELEELERIFAERTPRLAMQADLSTAPRACDVTMAGNNGGIVFIFKMPDSKNLTVYLTVVAATELVRGIAFATDRGGWDETALYHSRDPALRVPTGEDAHTAVQIVSLTTSAAGAEMLIHLAAADPSRTFMIGLPRQIAVEMLIGIQTIGARVGWWTNNGALAPKTLQ